MILQLDLNLARSLAEPIYIANRQHHVRYVGSNIDSIVGNHPLWRTNRMRKRGGHQMPAGRDNFQGGKSTLTTLLFCTIGTAREIPASNTGSIATPGLAITII
jgi:hypothetical protein